MTPEAKLYQVIKRKLEKTCHIQRIENLVERGSPDINVCHESGIEVWIELKIGIFPLIRPEQIAWGRRRARKNGRCFVLSRSEKKIRIWKHPDIEVEDVEGKKYKKVINASRWTIDLPIQEDELIKILFLEN